MINVCSDGNYIFHKTFGVFGGYGKDPAEVLETTGDQSLFIQKISTDLCAALKKLPTGGRSIFTSDSKSWRKDVEIEEGGYKSGERTGDWSIFYSLLSSYTEHLETMGFIHSKVNGAEGDDLLYFWADYFNSKGEDCIIITGDRDLHQLAKWKGDNWTVVWSNNSKNNLLTVPKDWEKRYLNKSSVASVFNMGDVMDLDREKLKKFSNNLTIQEVNHRTFIFEKMLLGDKGDTVPSVWESVEVIKEKEKVTRMTPSKSDKVMEAMDNSDWRDVDFIELIKNDEFLKWVSGVSLRVLKAIDSTENREKLIQNLLRNYTLMWLDKTVIPRWVIDDVIEELKRGLSKEDRVVTLDRFKIIENTPWTSGNVATPKQFDPFKNF